MRLVDRFSSRRFATPKARVSQATRPLDELPIGEVAVIVCFDTDDAVARRLFDLGFTPGESVVRLRQAPLGDPLMFRVGGVEIVLRRAQARRILVES